MSGPTELYGNTAAPIHACVRSAVALLIQTMLQRSPSGPGKPEVFNLRLLPTRPERSPARSRALPPSRCDLHSPPFLLISFSSAPFPPRLAGGCQVFYY